MESTPNSSKSLQRQMNWNEVTAEEYVDFNNELLRFHPPINSEMGDWTTKSVQKRCN